MDGSCSFLMKDAIPFFFPAGTVTKPKIYRLILQVSLSGFELMTSILFRTRRLTASLLDCFVIQCFAFVSTRCCSEVRNS